MRRRIPATVAFAGASFVVVGGALCATALAGYGRGDGYLISQAVTALAGLALIGAGAGILAGRPWARVLGIIAATVAAVAALAMMAFVTIMATGMGIGFSDPLFLSPFVFYLFVLAAALAIGVVLLRSGGWFGSNGAATSSDV